MASLDPFMLEALREVDALLPGSPPVSPPVPKNVRHETRLILDACVRVECPKCGELPTIQEMQGDDRTLRYFVQCHGLKTRIDFPHELYEADPEKFYKTVADGIDGIFR